MTGRVWPAAGEGEMKIVRWAATPGFAITVPTMWDLQIGWDEPLVQDSRFLWAFHEYEPERRIRGLYNLVWSHGHIVAAGPGAYEFFEVIKAKGISCGSIEAEIRDMVGYRE